MPQFRTPVPRYGTPAARFRTPAVQVRTPVPEFKAPKPQVQGIELHPIDCYSSSPLLHLFFTSAFSAVLLLSFISKEKNPPQRSQRKDEGRP
jgi:hypothetical protein